MDLDLKQWRDDHHPSKLPSALPLFVSEPHSNLSAFPSDHTPRIPRMGSYFSLSQWQELELQSLIFRHMIAGADVPPELIHLVKKSLLSSPFYLSHNCFPHFQQSLLQSGYWGRAAMDPEPGRCRRTDGKKWRCSRDVVAGQKYCERHMHRGKNRSRKHVETPTSAAAPYGSRAGGRTLRHFFDETDNATALSISTPSSDFSLKLGTGNGEGSERELNWGVTWETNLVAEAPMGGPLAEVLRSSTSNSSPTSVLH